MRVAASNSRGFDRVGTSGEPALWRKNVELPRRRAVTPFSSPGDCPNALARRSGGPQRVARTFRHAR
jgi:hypothetical protein